MLSVFLGLALLLNSGCHPSVTVKDEVITTSLGAAGGQDVDMFTEKTTLVDFNTIMNRWQNLNDIQCMLPITAIEDMETELSKLCTDYQAAGGTCNEQISNGINAVVKKLRMLRTKAKSAMVTEQE